MEQVGKYGILAGNWEDAEERFMEVISMVEKPTIEEAAERLAVTMADGEKKYFMVFGNYVLTPEVFEKLEKNISEGRTSRGEYQLTDALEAVRAEAGMTGYRIAGRAYDIGNPAAYRRTLNSFGTGND